MKTYLLFAVDEYFGFGHKGWLPWKIPEDLKHFKETTLGHTIIVGSKTFETLPKLSGRDVLVVGSGKGQYPSVESALEVAKDLESTKVFIIGGASIIEYALSNIEIDEIIMSVVNGIYTCDTVLNSQLVTKILDKSYELTEQINHREFTVNRYTLMPEIGIELSVLVKVRGTSLEQASNKVTDIIKPCVERFDYNSVYVENTFYL